jgi:hypothetical protein
MANKRMQGTRLRRAPDARQLGGLVHSLKQSQQ